MTKESAILRAYVLLSQGQYDDAEKMLMGTPGVPDTLAGADLFARLRFAQGREEEAREIWRRIHAEHPEFESATKALEAFEHPSPGPAGTRRKCYIGAVVALMVLGMGIWGFRACCREPEVPPADDVSIRPATKALVKYTVQPKDYVWRICQAFSCTLDEFREANPEVVANGYRIETGEMLWMPCESSEWKTRSEN